MTTEQGLSQSEITSIFQDSRGLMWFGTNAGLNKYDGYKFTIYKHDPNNPNSLSTNEVGVKAEDDRGALWIATWGGGLNLFDPETETFTHWKHDPGNPNSLSDDYITGIHLDVCHGGVLWIATEYGGLNRFDPETGEFTRWTPKWVIDREATHGTTEKFIMPIHEDASGDLWMGIGAGGLNRFDVETETFTHWLNEPGNPNSLSSDFIFSLYADTSGGGKLWIGTDGGGLNLFDLETGDFTHWRNDPGDPSSLSDDKITNIYEDKTGALWLGTLGGGVCKLNRNERRRDRFFHWRHDPDDSKSLSQNDVSAIYEDRAGAIWVGTYGGGLNRFDRESGTFEHWLNTPQDTIGSDMDVFYPQVNNIVAIHEDYHGILWIGTYGGKLLQFDRETERFVYSPYGPNLRAAVGTKYILSFYENPSDSGRALWLGTHANFGLAKMIRDDEGNGDFIHWRIETENPDGINSNDVYCIYGDESGKLWLGTGGGGLNIFDPKTEKFMHLLNEPGNPNSLGDSFVNRIYAPPADSGAILWLATQTGFDKLILQGGNPETARFFHYKEKDGLPNDYICDILADDRGHLWLSTLNGLSRFDPKTETFRNYDAHDGLQSGEFTRGAALKTRSGEMYFGGVNGLNSFHPDSLRDNPRIPPILITDFQILNESVAISHNGETVLKKHIFATEEIVLSHRDNVFSFEFAALDYTAPQKNRYAYKMEGFDKDWVYSGARRFVTYTNLAPGEYVFRVKGSNNDGVWNEDGASIRIIIAPPWWKTWWAYALYVIFSAALIYGVIRFEVNRERLASDLKIQQIEAQKLHEVDRMKSRFFANISHEFRTPLTLILGPLKMLLSGDFRNEAKDQFRVMLRNGQRLLRLINQLLDLSKLDAGRMTLQARPENIVDLLRVIVSQFSSLAERRRIDLKFTAPEQAVTAYVDRDKFEKIMVNLLSNAFKFTPEGGEISVQLAVSSDQCLVDRLNTEHCLQITVRDNGVGIPADRLSRIFDRFYQVEEHHKGDEEGSGIGLALTKELVKLHHGEIRVISEPGKGSTFVIRLPLGKEHLKREEIVEEVSRDQHSAISDRQQASNIEQPTSGNEHPTTSNKQPATSHSHRRRQPRYAGLYLQNSGHKLSSHGSNRRRAGF